MWTLLRPGPTRTSGAHSCRAAGLMIANTLLLVLTLLSGGAPMSPRCARASDTILSEDHYPKVALYTKQVGEMSGAQLDTLARYDLVAFTESPHVVSQVRQRNPDIRLFFLWMPQNIVKWQEAESSWFPDTSWSIVRLAQFYAIKNDWYLRDTNGARIPEWDGYAANWTRYCPRGTYGTARGMTYVEWLTEVAIPRITKSGFPWAPWGWESPSYTGLVLEIMADCVGSFGWQAYENADPDRDGIAEGVHSVCSLGGDQDSLSILYREMNEQFHDGLWPAVGNQLPIIMNAANPFINPSWWTDVSGVKLESWLGPPHPEWQSWSDWFYGLRDWSGQTEWGPGYYWAESEVGHTNIDSRNGWDLSLLQVLYNPADDPDFLARRKRLGLGTAMLGDGYFMYTRDQYELAWQPEYDRDFGRPLGPLERETYRGETLADTLYVRIFEQGFVEVNPSAVSVRGVPSLDARFSSWRTVETLEATATGPTRTRVMFATPDFDPNPVDRFELRYSTQPITPLSWHDATPYAGNPIEVPPGSTAYASVSGLAPSTTYYFAVRNWVRGRFDPNISNLAMATTLAKDSEEPVEVDTTVEASVWLRCSPIPSTGRLTILMQLAPGGLARLEVLDAAGRVVRTIAVPGAESGGTRRIEFTGTDDVGATLPAGVYWLRLESGGERATRRFILTR